MNSPDFGLKDLLATHDAIHDMYSNQVQGMLQSQQSKQNVGATGLLDAVAKTADIFGYMHDATKTETGAHPYLDKAVDLAKDAVGTLAGSRAVAAIPDIGPVVNGLGLLYTGYDQLQKQDPTGLLPTAPNAVKDLIVGD